MGFFVFLVVVIVAIVATKFFPLKKAVKWVPAVVLTVLFLIFTGVRMFHPIQSGEVGVVYRFGEIVGQRGEGIAVIAPWESIRTADTKVQRFTFDSITAASAETQDVFLVMTLNYSLSENAVQQLFRTVGPNWFDVIIPSRVLNFTKAETAKYSTGDIIPERETIRRAVQDRLAKDLEPYSITVNDLLIDNIDFSLEYKQAIEQKQVATEQAKRAQELVAQKEAEADQLRAEARGEADSVVIRAEGEAEANAKLAESLTPEILQWTAIQKLADDLQVALVPSGQGMILDPSSLLQRITPDTADQADADTPPAASTTTTTTVPAND